MVSGDKSLRMEIYISAIIVKANHRAMENIIGKMAVVLKETSKED